MLEINFKARLKKAKAIAGLSQKQLAIDTGLSLSTINELESGLRDTITKNTLLKLLKVLDKNILCDDYCNFILNQEDNMDNLIKKYGITNLCNLINSHHSTVYDWKNGKTTISKKKYIIIKKLKG